MCLTYTVFVQPKGFEAVVGMATGALATKQARRPDARLELRVHRLLKLNRSQRSTVIANLLPYRSVELAQRLAETAFDLRYGCVDRMMAAAEAAVEVAEAVTDHPCSTIVADVRAECLAVLANAHRIAGELAESKEAFRRSFASIEDGSGDPLVAARVGGLFATLLLNIGELDRAETHFRAVLRTYITLDEPHRAARTLVQLGRVLRVAGKLVEAEDCLASSLGLLDFETEPSLVVAAMQLLVVVLQERGRPVEALAMHRRVGPLVASVGTEAAQLRYRWTEGWLAAESGELRLGEVHLSGVRAAFIEQNLCFDAALVSLDLALVLLRQGRTAEVAALAEETYAAFAARQLDQRASAALLLWVNAVRSQTLNADVLSRLASELKATRSAEP